MKNKGNKVGKGEITSADRVSKYYSSLQPQYEVYYLDFKKRREQIIEASNLRRAQKRGENEN